LPFANRAGSQHVCYFCCILFYCCQQLVEHFINAALSKSWIEAQPHPSTSALWTRKRGRETVAMRLACKGIPEVHKTAFSTLTLLFCILILILPLFMLPSSPRFFFSCVK
jgi:hypothetical protein